LTALVQEPLLLSTAAIRIHDDEPEAAQAAVAPNGNDGAEAVVETAGEIVAEASIDVRSVAPRRVSVSR
jgi:hypothetical protein